MTTNYTPTKTDILKRVSLPNEIWKDYGNRYAVSNHGRIMAFYSKSSGKMNPKIMNPALDGSGYLRTVLYGKTIKVHRIVAEVFIENKENKQTINHINGIKTDNHIQNLEWNTHSENCLHSFKIGLQLKKNGELNGMAKITEEIVKEIRAKFKPLVYGRKKLAQEYGLKEHHIKDIVTKRTWKHVV